MHLTQTLGRFLGPVNNGARCWDWVFSSILILSIMAKEKKQQEQKVSGAFVQMASLHGFPSVFIYKLSLEYRLFQQTSVRHSGGILCPTCTGPSHSIPVCICFWSLFVPGVLLRHILVTPALRTSPGVDNPLSILQLTFEV